MLSKFMGNMNIVVGRDLEEYSHMSAVPYLNKYTLLDNDFASSLGLLQNIKTMDYCLGSYLY